jgi:hypothetical protein
MTPDLSFLGRKYLRAISRLTALVREGQAL